MQTLKEGNKLPNISGIDDQGNTINLQSYLGKKVIVFFYPKASTPGCTAQACNLTDNYSELQDRGFVVLGVSADSVKRQANFKAKYKFPFPLIADEDKTFINAFGVWGPKKFMGKTYDGIHRTTFIANEEGVITSVISKVKTKDHAAQILELNL